MPVWLDLQVKQGFVFPPTLALIHTFWKMRAKPTTRKYPLSIVTQSIISVQLSRCHLFPGLGLLYCPFILLAIGACLST